MFISSSILLILSIIATYICHVSCFKQCNTQLINSRSFRPIRIEAAANENENTGFFKLGLSQIGNQASEPTIVESYSEENKDDKEKDIVLDEKTKKRVLRQLTFAFDHYQVSYFHDNFAVNS